MNGHIILKLGGNYRPIHKYRLSTCWEVINIWLEVSTARC